VSPQKLTHLHTYLFPDYNTAPAVGCTVSFRISDCRKTGSVATVELLVRLREEPRGAGRSQPRKNCSESRMVTITPSQPIRPLLAAPIISNSVTRQGIFRHAPSGLQQNLAIQHPVPVTNVGEEHTRVLNASGQNADEVTSTVKTKQNQHTTC